MNSTVKTASPFISVIINCYNSEKYLKETIESILNQTYQDWEIVFWDNQSTDKSAEIVKSFEEVRIHYYYSPKRCLHFWTLAELSVGKVKDRRQRARRS